MKIRTDLKAGDVSAHCHQAFNNSGKCSKILCDFPPFVFPCTQTGLIGSGQNYYGSQTGAETAE